MRTGRLGGDLEIALKGLSRNGGLELEGHATLRLLGPGRGPGPGSGPGPGPESGFATASWRRWLEAGLDELLALRPLAGLLPLSGLDLSVVL